MWSERAEYPGGCQPRPQHRAEIGKCGHHQHPPGSVMPEHRHLTDWNKAEENLGRGIVIDLESEKILQVFGGWFDDFHLHITSEPTGGQGRIQRGNRTGQRGDKNRQRMAAGEQAEQRRNSCIERKIREEMGPVGRG